MTVRALLLAFFLSACATPTANRTWGSALIGAGLGATSSHLIVAVGVYGGTDTDAAGALLPVAITAGVSSLLFVAGGLLLSAATDLENRGIIKPTRDSLDRKDKVFLPKAVKEKAAKEKAAEKAAAEKAATEKAAAEKAAADKAAKEKAATEKAAAEKAAAERAAAEKAAKKKATETRRPMSPKLPAWSQ